MRLALLSDIHANGHALDACLQHARAQQVQQFAFLGDMVGYGAQPREVLDTVMALHAQGAVVLQGNHDALAVSPRPFGYTLGDSTAGWTHDRLPPAQRDWLAQLPLTHVVGHCLLVHASAHEPSRWHYVDSAGGAARSLHAAVAAHGEVRYVFSGHVHLQTLYYEGKGGDLLPFTPQVGVSIPVANHRRWLATVGSVGQPRDGDPRAMYAVLDTQQRQLTFHRVAYDVAAAAQAILDAGLEPYFAQRLEIGR